jgi:ABC-type proline/glycine betaine transport system permease subunit
MFSTPPTEWVTSAWQRLVRIELPLALPLIVAGLRIAVVTVIGIATVAAFIDAGGLGTIILMGIDQNYTEKILVGGLLTALLATFFDVVLSNAEKALLRRQKVGPLSKALTWIMSHQPEFYRALGQHLLMCGVSMVFCAGLGLAACRSHRQSPRARIRRESISSAPCAPCPASQFSPS